MKMSLLKRFTLVSFVFSIFGLGSALAQDEPVEVIEVYEIEEVVEDPVGILPQIPVDSVFGFGENIIDTPRSVSSISAEMIEQYGIDDINGLIAFSPGAFTTSFFWRRRPARHSRRSGRDLLSGNEADRESRQLSDADRCLRSR